MQSGNTVQHDVLKEEEIFYQNYYLLKLQWSLKFLNCLVVLEACIMLLNVIINNQLFKEI